MKRSRLGGEPDSFTEKRDEYLELASDLGEPESVRTPGRTWTRFPEVEVGENEEVSPEVEVEGDAEVFTGGDAVEEAGDRMLDAVKPRENRLTAVHAACLNSMVLVRTDGEARIAIENAADQRLFSHLVVDAGESSDITVNESFRGEAEVVTSVGEFYLGDNSSVSYNSVQSIGSGFNYSARKAVVGRDAEMNWLNTVFGSSKTRSRIETVLKGDSSSVEKLGAWYATGDQHLDIPMFVRHIGENTECDMNSRAVVDDTARSVYKGVQEVAESAPGTKSFQRENALTLSEKAEVDASPKLMIENNEVEASHAATTGRIQEEQLHYMKSRGLTEKQARRLVVKGFFEPLLDRIEDEEFGSRVRREVEKKLNG